MDSLEAKVRCLEVAAQIMPRGVAHPVDDVAKAATQLYNHIIGQESAPAKDTRKEPRKDGIFK